MLTLTRRVGESIKIGNEIEVIVWGVQQGKVRIGIIAPSEVAINRKETLPYNTVPAREEKKIVIID